MKTLSLLFLLSFSISIFSQDPIQDYEHIIQSEAFDKERKIHVFLPARYFRDTTEKFTVTYVLDAHYDQLWNMMKSNIDYLVDSRSVFPMIVVGIQAQNRGKEFTPPSIPLREHLEKEVFPLIEKNYRVNDFRTIVGHSRGGLFVGDVLFSKDKDMFNAYLAISPVLAYKNIIYNRADSMLQAPTDFRKYLFCSYGSVGEREVAFGGQVQHLDSIYNAHPTLSLVFQQQQIVGMDHWSVVIPSLNIGLVNMCRNYWADQKVIEDFAKDTTASKIQKGVYPKLIKDKVAQFNQIQQENFDYHYEAGPRYLRFVAEDFIELGDYNTALQLYNWVAESNPESWRTELSLAYINRLKKDYPTAVEHYKLSLKYLEQNKAQENKKLYESMKKNLNSKIEKYGNM
jgi:predicted alpha/beta superfamily hydrolase